MALSLASSAGSWRSYCAEPERVDARLREALDAERPIVLTSRFSTPTGENARTSAINTLYEAARVLARQSGIDVVRALPSREDLDVRLHNAPVTRSKRLGKGQDIQHRFVEVDLRPHAPVVILVATGSGASPPKASYSPSHSEPPRSSGSSRPRSSARSGGTATPATTTSSVRWSCP